MVFEKQGSEFRGSVAPETLRQAAGAEETGPAGRCCGGVHGVKADDGSGGEPEK